MRARTQSGESKRDERLRTSSSRALETLAEGEEGKALTEPAQCELTLEMHGERWLLERLKKFGADVYCDGEFETLADRFAYVIQRERLEQVICGRGPNGKPERFLDTWCRLYGRPWDPPKLAQKVAP